MGNPEKGVEAAGSALNRGDDQHVHVGLGFGSSWATNSNSCSLLSATSSHAIPGSNIGFQMLKKCGWKDEHADVGLGFGSSWAPNSNSCSLLSATSNHAIPGSNIGFQMLKKCGWKEGSGLGVAEQGRLYPIDAQVKNNKRGIGAESKAVLAKKTKKSPPKEIDLSKRAGKKSKRLRKLQEEEKRMREREFEREFFREFWPDNV